MIGSTIATSTPSVGKERYLVPRCDMERDASRANSSPCNKNNRLDGIRKEDSVDQVLLIGWLSELRSWKWVECARAGRE